MSSTTLKNQNDVTHKTKQNKNTPLPENLLIDCVPNSGGADWADTTFLANDAIHTEKNPSASVGVNW